MFPSSLPRKPCTLTMHPCHPNGCPLPATHPSPTHPRPVHARVHARVHVQLLADISSGTALRYPGTLARFLVLVFADLKAQRFVHWFAHPTLTPRTPFVHASPLVGLGTVLDPNALRALGTGVGHLAASHGGTLPPYFLVDPAPGCTCQCSMQPVAAVLCWARFMNSRIYLHPSPPRS